MQFKGRGGAASTEPFIRTSEFVDVSTIFYFVFVQRNTKSQEKFRVLKFFPYHASDFSFFASLYSHGCEK